MTVRPAALVLAAAVLSGCGTTPAGSAGQSLGATPSPAPTQAANPSPTAGLSSAVVASIDLGGEFHSISAGPDGVWLLGSGRAVRVDPATNAIAGEIAIPESEFGNIRVGGKSLWVTDFAHDTVLRLDPAAGKVVATIPVGTNPEGLEVRDGVVWVSNHRGGSITKVDAVTNKVIATLQFAPTGASGPKNVVFLGGDVWTTVPNSVSVYRLDPGTGDIVAKIIIPGDLSGPVTDGAYVYVLKGPKVVRVDPAINLLDRGFVAGAVPLAYGQSALWSLVDADLARLDPTTLAPTQRWRVLDVPGRYVNFAFDGGTIWLLVEGQVLLRVDPSR